MRIEVRGAIIQDQDQWIYDWFGIPATSAAKVNKLIGQAQDGEELEVLINSGGGSVFAGSEIFTTLKSYKGQVKGIIPSIAGSSASIIAMGCNKLAISPTAQIMIHNASGNFQGDYHDMNLGSEILKGINESISNAYMLKTGLNQEELLAMMNKETWLTAQKALEMKFVDEIMFSDNAPNFINSVTDKNGLLPKEVLDKVRNEFKGKLGENTDFLNLTPQQDHGLDIAKAKLNLLMTI